MSTIRDILARTESFLAARRTDSPKLSAQVLLAHVLGLDRLRLFLDLDRPLTESELAPYRELIRRRGEGEPVAYLVGQREFYGLDFRVCPGVLIPRPETEHLIEAAEGHFPVDRPFIFADIGVGSGAIAVTLLVRRPLARGIGLDLNPTPLAVSRANAVRHDVGARLQLVRADLGSVLRPGCLDLLVSNPPYVSQSEYAGLSREVAAYEPVEALVPGPDGLEAYRRLAPQAASALRPGGLLLLEIGCAQAGDVYALLADRNVWTKVRTTRDLAGLDRVVSAVRV